MADWRERADEAWQALDAACATRNPRGVRIHEPGERRVTHAASVARLLTTSVLLRWAGADPGRLHPEAVWRSLSRYRLGPGFADVPLFGKRYYQTNARIGLATAQGALARAGSPQARTWWRRSEDTVRYVSSGVLPGGGLPFVEGDRRVDLAASGAAGALAAALQPAPAGIGERWQPMARDALAVVSLQSPGDEEEEEASPSRTRTPDSDPEAIVSTAWLVQLLVWSGRSAEAVQLATQAAPSSDEDGWWRHPVAPVADWCRALLRVAACYPTDDRAGAFRGLVADHVDRLWREGRGPSGLFDRARRSPDGVVSDHAAATGLLACLALTEEQQRLLW